VKNLVRNKLIISDEEWADWRWHIKNRITKVEDIRKYLKLSFEEEQKIREVIKTFSMSITPYYASLMDPGDKNCPIRRQALPSPRELEVFDYEMLDPLHEDKDSPVPGLTHRYPDRALLLSTNFCSMNCRHCTRKRKVGDKQQTIDMGQIEQGIKYIEETPVIRDVLISGGDPFILETDFLEKIIKKIHCIPHVEIIRIGTRTPVVLPQRITPELIRMLKKYQPIWINTHYNHPREITTDSKKALAMLADAGFPLGNQSVLLRGVNHCPDVMKKLVHLLVKNRVRPYYLYQCDLSQGIEHFRMPISQGIEIMERLIGHTSGLAVPRYIVDAPGGCGKIPIQPNYVISHCNQKVILRNYEGVITKYDESVVEEDNGELCPRLCSLCEKKKVQGENPELIGLEKLLDGDADEISLIPEGNVRAERFTDEDENEQQEQRIDFMPVTSKPTNYGKEITIEKNDFSLDAFISSYNKRVRLIDYIGPKTGEVAEELKNIANSYDFTSKIYAKVRPKDSEIFLKKGFTKEGVIKGYFNGKDAVVVSNYLEDARKKTPEPIQKKEEDIEERLKNYKPEIRNKRTLPEYYRIQIPADMDEYRDLAALYDEVFETYPFPIMNPEYLEKTAKTHVIYAIIYNNNKVVAAASAEKDLEHKNAEMTDFATLPSERGKGLASILLSFLENEVRQNNIKNLYTIARSRSLGMNRVFKKAGYAMTGKLINNCYICGQFENMNIWCKALD